MTYNFDPERWYENEYRTLEVLHKKGNITDIEFEEARSDLLRRYEEMLSRLDGTYQLPKCKPLGICISPEMTKSEALKLEFRIKQLPADNKIAALITKENEMTISKKRSTNFTEGKNKKTSWNQTRV